jgi:hypothetical protein
MANIKYNKELGGQPYIFELEDGTKLKRWPNSQISIKRDGIVQNVKASEVVETDDILL